MKQFICLFLILLCSSTLIGQTHIEHYKPISIDSLRIGPGEKDFMSYIASGYTLMLPESKAIKGVLIFLEDSGYDQKNKSAHQLYDQAAHSGYAVLSISTELPFDFFFRKESIYLAHNQIQEVFEKHNIPNQNIFFLGTSLTGHRAMRYIAYMKENTFDFQLNIKGLILVDFTLDWTRKWRQHQREKRIQRNNLWEPTFMNYMLESNLGGTPETHPERYHNFSAYSYFDEKNETLSYYKDYAIRAYTEPAISRKLKSSFKTLYESNTADMVGFLAALRLEGNPDTELIIFQPKDNPSTKKNGASLWDAIDKNELMDWIVKQSAN